MSPRAAPLERLDAGLTTVAATAAVACLALAVAAGFWQVVTRFLLSDPAVWSEALVRLSLVWMTMLGFGVAVREGALVSIDAMALAARGRFAAVLRLTILAATVGLCLVLGGFGVTMAVRVAGQTMAGLEISIAWGYAAIPAGCVFGLLGALSRYVQTGREAEAVR